jgi:predicted Na+-dependent transporter
LVFYILSSSPLLFLTFFLYIIKVAMTAISTIFSIFMLPFNLFLYAGFAYDNDVREIVKWDAVAVALAVVICAIMGGLLTSYKFGTNAFRLLANRLGNVAGILLVLLTAIISNSTAGARLWDHNAKFYLGVALPVILGLFVATCVTTAVQLRRPERVTVSVECCIQNTGIAVTVALTMFDGDELAKAAAVPFYYGIVELVAVSAYCLVMWKCGWTKAPKEVPLWNMLATSYEVLPLEKEAEADGFYYVDQRDARDSLPTGHVVNGNFYHSTEHVKATV